MLSLKHIWEHIECFISIENTEQKAEAVNCSFSQQRGRFNILGAYGAGRALAGVEINLLQLR